MSSKGQSIIEVIVAVSILVIIAASSMVAILGSFSTTRLAEEETKATLIAIEGIEASQSIKHQGWLNLVSGTHGLSNLSGVWSFLGTSDTDSSGKFTRTLTIADVQRDITNNIVASGGTLDPNTKQVTSSVSWDFTPTRSNTVTSTTLLTNWLQGSWGSGGGAGGTEASSLVVDTTANHLTNGGSRLRGITIENTSATPITITHITPTWTNAALIRDFQINGNDVWDRNGPGLPSGSQPSGITLDIQDFVLPANSGLIDIDRLRFTSSVVGTTINITFTMSDASTLVIPTITL